MIVLSIFGLIFAGILAFLAVVAARAATTAVLRLPNRMRPFGEATSASGSLGARLAIGVAGLLAAYGFSAALSVAGLMLDGKVARDGAPVVDVVPSFPAAQAGIKNGDRIVTIDGTPMADFGQLRAFIERNPERPVPLEVERQGSPRLALSITPRAGKLGLQRRMQAMPAEEAVRQGVRTPLQAWGALIERNLAPSEPGSFMGPVGVRAPGSAPHELSQFLITIAARINFTVFPLLLVATGALLCAGPRSRGDEEIVSPAEVVLVGGRPVIRLLARFIDTLMVGMSFLGVTALVGRGEELLLLLMLPMEALLLATWGSTPGKWLLGVIVRDRAGRKLTFRQALHRAGAVLLFGQGASLEYGVLTGVLGYRRLRRVGETYWDTLGAYRVSHDQVSPARAVIAMAVAIASGLALALSRLP